MIRSIFLIPLAIALCASSVVAEDNAAEKEQLAKEWLKYMEGEWDVLLKVAKGMPKAESVSTPDKNWKVKADLVGEALVVRQFRTQRNANELESVHLICWDARRSAIVLYPLDSNGEKQAIEAIRLGKYDVTPEIEKASQIADDWFVRKPSFKGGPPIIFHKIKSDMIFARKEDARNPIAPVFIDDYFRKSEEGMVHIREISANIGLLLHKTRSEYRRTNNNLKDHTSQSNKRNRKPEK